MVVDFFVRQCLKPKTIRNYYGFVSAVLVNAGINVRPPRLPQKERPEIYIPDEATVRKLLQIVEGTELEIPVMLAAFGPLRRGEICALSMDDIKDGVCHVHHDLAQNADGEWVMKAPKTYSSDRYIELPDFVADAIKRNGSIHHRPHSGSDFVEVFRRLGAERSPAFPVSLSPAFLHQLPAQHRYPGCVYHAEIRALYGNRTPERLHAYSAGPVKDRDGKILGKFSTFQS